MKTCCCTKPGSLTHPLSAPGRWWLVGVLAATLRMCVVGMFKYNLYCNTGSVPRGSLPIIINTSSTAQGGGGSFKNRKPIGEVSCCGAKSAERTHWWIERWLSVSAFLSFFSFSLSLSFGIYLQSYLSSHLPIYLSIHVAIVRCVYSPNYKTLHLSVYPAMHPSTYLSLLFFFRPSRHLFL